MQPGSPSVSPTERSRSRAADLIGTVIAVITLVAPLAVIAYYSSESEPLPSMGYTNPPAKSR